MAHALRFYFEDACTTVGGGHPGGEEGFMDTGTILLVALAGVAIALFVLLRKARMGSRDAPPDAGRTEWIDRRAEEAGDAERSKTGRARAGPRALRPLSSGDSRRFLEAWRASEALLSDSPAAAVADADRLARDVIRARGVEVTGDETTPAPLLEHGQLVEHYRGARKIALANQRGEATTADLVEAMFEYRAIFEDLLAGDPGADLPQKLDALPPQQDEPSRTAGRRAGEA